MLREVREGGGVKPRARGKGRLVPTGRGAVSGVNVSWYVWDLRSVAGPQFRGPLTR